MTTYDQVKAQRQAEADQWLAEHSNLLESESQTNAAMEHNITFDSVLMEIAIEEADDWAEMDTTQSYIEYCGGMDVTGLAHWQGQREQVADSAPEMHWSKTNRGMFIQDKFNKHIAKHDKARARFCLEMCYNKAGGVRVKLASPELQAEQDKEAKAKKIAAKLAALDAKADNRRYKKG